MDNKIKNIIKLIGILISLILLIVICMLIVSYNNASYEEMSTPVHIAPAPKKIEQPKPVIKKLPENKPITRDENNMPKSDYKVPEIG